MDLVKLKSDWMKVSCQWGGSNDTAQSGFVDLCECYQNKTRFYHTLEHVVNMLTLAEQYRDMIKSPEAIYFATWFHDAIQSIGKDNEKESALYAAKVLEGLNVPQEIINKVRKMIFATKDHSEQNDEDVKLFIDLDLAILASDNKTYVKYQDNCRKEYLIPNWMYKKGRVKFIKSMLKSKSIFQTVIFQNQYEQPAIKNIQQELSRYTN